MSMEPPLTSPPVTLSKLSLHSSSSFMLPEIDRLIAIHLDRVALTCATQVCKKWHSTFNPILWRQISLQHNPADDDHDEDFFIARATSPPSLSLPSSCSSTWTNMSVSSSPTSSFPTLWPESHPNNLTMFQQAFLSSSQNHVLKSLVRHGHLVHELKATGITDQEMGVIASLCTSLRVFALIGGRYTAETLSDFFHKRQDSIQVVRFQSCVHINDIFHPLKYLSNLREFELHGSFVGNTITSPYFFERDLFPVLNNCPRLRSIVILQVYITDQHINLGWESKYNDGGGDGGGTRADAQLYQNFDQDKDMISVSQIKKFQQPLSPTLSTQSMLSAQLRLSSMGSSSGNANKFIVSSALKSLNLDCGDIAEHVVVALLARCPQLEQLSLDWSRNLTDASLVSLRHYCPNLTTISLSRCQELTEDGYKALFMNFPNLISVNISFNAFSDNVLVSLAESCQFLEYLNINSCGNITDLGVQAILLNCAFLSTFSLRSIPGLSYLLFDDMITPFSIGQQHSTIYYDHKTNRYRRWACIESLQYLYLSDLVNPSKVAIERLRHQRNLISTNGVDNVNLKESLPGDRLIQMRIQQIKALRHLTIGGFNLDIRVVLDVLEKPSTLESLQITKLKRNLLISDAQWLLEYAAPRLKELAIPIIENRGVIDWIESRRPGLLKLK